MITSGADVQFREFFEEKVQRGPPRIEIVNRKVDYCPNSPPHIINFNNHNIL